MENEFENALQGLLNLNYKGNSSEETYNELFRTMITSSMKICSETDFGTLVNQKIETAEKLYGLKMEITDETDPYKKLREVVRFEMSREACIGGKEFEICCTESNFAVAIQKFRSEIEKIVPESQKDVLDSMTYSLYSDFTNFFVCATLDMIADYKIYAMKEFRPLQINAMGKEIRTSINIMKKQVGKPQKSEVVTNWFCTMMILPALLFKKLYAISMVEMFANSEKYTNTVEQMFESFIQIITHFAPGDEYKILKDFLIALKLEDGLTIREKTYKTNEKSDSKNIVN